VNWSYILKYLLSSTSRLRRQLNKERLLQHNQPVQKLTTTSNFLQSEQGPSYPRSGFQENSFYSERQPHLPRQRVTGNSTAPILSGFLNMEPANDSHSNSNSKNYASVGPTPRFVTRSRQPSVHTPTPFLRDDYDLDDDGEIILHTYMLYCLIHPYNTYIYLMDLDHFHLSINKYIHTYSEPVDQLSSRFDPKSSTTKPVAKDPFSAQRVQPVNLPQSNRLPGFILHLACFV
jgi:hypothetical protein